MYPSVVTTCALLALSTLQSTLASPVSTSDETTKELGYPPAGSFYRVRGRRDMTLRFFEVPSFMGPGANLAQTDIGWSRDSYSNNLKLSCDRSTPKRSYSSPLGDPTTGEQDCTVWGIVYRVRPEKDATGTWTFTVQDTMDAVRGIADATNMMWDEVRESKIVVSIADKEAATIWFLNKRRNDDTLRGKCLDPQPASREGGNVTMIE